MGNRRQGFSLPNLKRAYEAAQTATQRETVAQALRQNVLMPESMQAGLQRHYAVGPIEIMLFHQTFDPAYDPLTLQKKPRQSVIKSLALTVSMEGERLRERPNGHAYLVRQAALAFSRTLGVEEDVQRQAAQLEAHSTHYRRSKSDRKVMRRLWNRARAEAADYLTEEQKRERCAGHGMAQQALREFREALDKAQGTIEGFLHEEKRVLSEAGHAYAAPRKFKLLAEAFSRQRRGLAAQGIIIPDNNRALHQTINNSRSFSSI